MSELGKLIGVGKTITERLEHTGHNTLKRLVNANPVKLRRKTWLPEKTIVNLIVSAKKYLVEQEFEKHRKKKEAKRFFFKRKIEHKKKVKKKKATK